MNFLNPPDALIPKILFSFFADFGIWVTFGARGSVSVGFWGSCQLYPFFGGGSSQGALSTPPPRKRKPGLPSGRGTGSGQRGLGRRSAARRGCLGRSAVRDRDAWACGSRWHPLCRCRRPGRRVVRGRGGGCHCARGHVCGTRGGGGPRPALLVSACPTSGPKGRLGAGGLARLPGALWGKPWGTRRPETDAGSEMERVCHWVWRSATVMCLAWAALSFVCTSADTRSSAMGTHETQRQRALNAITAMPTETQCNARALCQSASGCYCCCTGSFDGALALALVYPPPPRRAPFKLSRRRVECAGVPCVHLRRVRGGQGASDGGVWVELGEETLFFF